MYNNNNQLTYKCTIIVNQGSYKFEERLAYIYVFCVLFMLMCNSFVFIYFDSAIVLCNAKWLIMMVIKLLKPKQDM